MKKFNMDQDLKDKINKYSGAEYLRVIRVINKVANECKTKRELRSYHKIYGVPFVILFTPIKKDNLMTTFISNYYIWIDCGTTYQAYYTIKLMGLDKINFAINQFNEGVSVDFKELLISSYGLTSIIDKINMRDLLIALYFDTRVNINNECIENLLQVDI